MAKCDKHSQTNQKHFVCPWKKRRAHSNYYCILLLLLIPAFEPCAFACPANPNAHDYFGGLEIFFSYKSLSSCFYLNNLNNFLKSITENF
jgi:hypothetical protein